MAIVISRKASGVIRFSTQAISKAGIPAALLSPKVLAAAGAKRTKAGISVPANAVRHVRGCKAAAALLKVTRESGDAVNTAALRARTVPGACCYSPADFKAPKKGAAKKGAAKKGAAKKATPRSKATSSAPRRGKATGAASKASAAKKA